LGTSEVLSNIDIACGWNNVSRDERCIVVNYKGINEASSSSPSNSESSANIEVVAKESSLNVSSISIESIERNNIESRRGNIKMKGQST